MAAAAARESWATPLFQYIFRALTEGAYASARCAARRALAAGFAAEARGALRLAKVPSPADVEAALDRFLREGWLVEVDARRDCLALGARALAELRDTLRLALDDRCHLCQDVVVYGPVAEYKNGAERRLVDGRGAVLCAAACSPRRATPRPPRTCAAPPLAQKPARR
jgi:hypothetical protein